MMVIGFMKFRISFINLVVLIRKWMNLVVIRFFCNYIDIKICIINVYNKIFGYFKYCMCLKVIFKNLNYNLCS